MRHKALSAFSWLVYAFLYLPLLIMIAYSFNESRFSAVWSGFSWKWYASLWKNERVLEAFQNSLFIAVVSSVLATVLGTFAALALHRRGSRAMWLWTGILYMPILIPDIVMGISLLILFSHIHLALGKWTVIIAHVTFSLSFVVVIILARLAGTGRDLEEAAQDLGAKPWQTLRHVTFPVIMPGVVASLLLSFTLSLDDFVITFFVAGPESTTLPIYIYGLVKRGISPEVNALSTIMVVVTAVLVGIAEWYRRRGIPSGVQHTPSNRSEGGWE